MISLSFISKKIILDGKFMVIREKWKEPFILLFGKKVFKGSQSFLNCANKDN